MLTEEELKKIATDMKSSLQELSKSSVADVYNKAGDIIVRSVADKAMNNEKTNELGAEALKLLPDIIPALSALRKTGLNLAEAASKLTKDLIEALDTVNLTKENLKLSIRIIDILTEMVKEERAKANYYESTLSDLNITFIPWGLAQNGSNIPVDDWWRRHREIAAEEINVLFGKKYIDEITK
jgi:hypothetical protein